MINKYNLLFLPKMKTEANYYEQKSILKRNNLPTYLCESLSSKKIKKFKKLFLSVSMKKQKEKGAIKKNSLFSINDNNLEQSTILKNNIKSNEGNSHKKNSLINKETELKINKLMDKFNTDKKLQKNSVHDLIKGRIFKNLKNYLVMKDQKYNTIFENNDDFSTTKEQKDFLFKKKLDILSKKKLNILTDITPKLFNTERITRRFEDIHMTPEEYLKANFSKEEIEIIIKNVNYFGLNKEPLKDWNLNVNLTLKDSLNKEDEALNQKIKEKKKNLKISNNNLRLKLSIDNDNKSYGENEDIFFINNNINDNIISEKKIKTSNIIIPKLNLKNINHINNNTFTGQTNKKRVKHFKFLINYKNKLLYKNPATCSRYKKHIKMNNSKTSNFFIKPIYIKRSNSKHIERFENKQILKSEFIETKNILNEIKSNYMKKYHDKVTQDNIKKNKIKFNNDLKINKTKLKTKIKSDSQYIQFGQNGEIFLSERLWKY